MSETQWQFGMAARDPETGAKWRMLEHWGWTHERGETLYDDQCAASVKRAKAAGPDMGDPVTAAYVRSLARDDASPLQPDPMRPGR